MRGIWRLAAAAAFLGATLASSGAEAKEKHVLEVKDARHGATMTWSYRSGKDRRGVDIKVKATENQFSMVCTGWVHVERGPSTWAVGTAIKEGAEAAVAGTEAKISNFAEAMDDALRDHSARERIVGSWALAVKRCALGVEASGEGVSLLLAGLQRPNPRNYLLTPDDAKKVADFLLAGGQ